MKSYQNTVLREYIRQTIKNKLNEDDMGPASMDYYSAGMSYMEPGFYTGGTDPGPLLKAFVEPFTDVFKTTVASVKKVTTDAATLLRVAFDVVLTTIIPIYTSDYQAIFDRRDEKMDKIKDEYADVFERTDAALGTDAKLLAFMINPGVFLASAAALKAPAATKELLSVATGGISDSALEGAKDTWDSIQRSLLNGKIDKKKAAAKKNAAYEQLVAYLSGKDKNESYQRHSIKTLIEAKNNDDSTFEEFLSDVLKNPNVVKALSEKIKANSRMKVITKQLSDIEKETLTSAEESAKKIVSSVSSFNGIKSLSSKDPKGAKALGQIKEPNQEKILVTNAKKAASQMLAVTLKTRMNMLPKDSEIYKEYEKTLQKVSKF